MSELTANKEKKTGTLQKQRVTAYFGVICLMKHNKKLENSFAIFASLVFSIAFFGGLVAIILFILLPLIGIVLSVVLTLIIAIVFWLVMPVLMLSAIAWIVAKLSR